MKRTMCWLAAAIAVSGASVAYSDDTRADMWNECRAKNSCTIEYDHLAGQETDPYLFLGKAINRDHPQWRRYRRALRSYTDVRDCLVESEQSKAIPNLLMIDWQRVGTTRGAEICVFRIARSLGSIERIRKWMKFHEFHTTKLLRVFSDDYQPRYETQRVSILQGTWTTEQLREIRPSWIASVTGFDAVSAYDLVIEFSVSEAVVGVRVISETK